MSGQDDYAGAWAEGMDAFPAGKLREDNPYPVGTAGRAAWAHGWTSGSWCAPVAALARDVAGSLAGNGRGAGPDKTESLNLELAKGKSMSAESKPVIDPEFETALAELQAGQRVRFLEKQAAGRSGWNDPAVCPSDDLLRRACRALREKRYADAANLIAMLRYRHVRDIGQN